MCQEVWAWHSPVLFNPCNSASRLEDRQYTDKETKAQVLSQWLKETYPVSSRAVSPILFDYFVALFTHIAQLVSHLLPQPHFLFLITVCSLKILMQKYMKKTLPHSSSSSMTCDCFFTFLPYHLSSIPK